MKEENVKQPREEICGIRQRTFLENLEDNLDYQLKQVEKIRKAICYIKQNPDMEETIRMFNALYS